MRLRVLAVGTRMPSWVAEACADYTRRLPRELALTWIEIPLGQRGRGRPVERAVAAESGALLAQLAPAARHIALDVEGRSWTTEQLATALRDWQMDGRPVDFLIGGPDGLSRECLAAVHGRWSLSALTLPHPLVRVVLAEQIYRAWSINQGHPYHR